MRYFRHMDRPVSDLQLVLKPWPSALAEFGGILYSDHVRFDSCQPPIRASIGALIPIARNYSKCAL